MEKLIQYLNNFWTKTIVPTVKSSWDRNERNTQDIVDAVDGKTSISIDNHETISKPVVDAVDGVAEAIKGIPQVDLSRQIDNTKQLEEVNKQLAKIAKKDNKIVIKNDLNKALAIFKSNKDKKELVQAIQNIEIPENKDYTELLQAIANKKEMSTSKMEDILTKVAKTSDLADIAGYLQTIIDKKDFTLDDFVKKGRIKVEVDRVGGAGGGGGGGLNQQESDALIGVNESKSQVEKYSMSDFDAATSLIYIGNLDKDGNWFIKKIDVTTDIGTAVYIKGDTGYSTAWGDRTTLSYDTFDNIF